jgi:MFS family permease
MDRHSGLALAHHSEDSEESLQTLARRESSDHHLNHRHSKHPSLGPDFLHLLSGQTISQFGSWLGALGLLAILTLDATPAQMGALETLRALPMLLLGLFAGVSADRLRRRPVLIWTDIGRGLILGLVALAALMGRLRIGHLYAVGFVAGALTVFFNTAYRAYLPSVVPRDRLVEANSRLAAGESLAEIVSPGLGGLLVNLFGAPLTMMVDAGSFLLSALLVGSTRTPEPSRATGADGDYPVAVWREIRSGSSFLIGHSILRPLAGRAATRSFFGGFFAALYSLYVLRTVELSATILGLLIGAGGIGALVGSFAAGQVSRRLGTGRTLIATATIGSGLNLLVPLAQGPPWLGFLLLLASQLIGDFFGAIYDILEMSVRQSTTPDGMLGRVNASFDFVAQGIGTVGIFVGGLLGSRIGTRWALLVAVFGNMSATAWLLISPVRRLDQ